MHFCHTGHVLKAMIATHTLVSDWPCTKLIIVMMATHTVVILAMCLLSHCHVGHSCVRNAFTSSLQSAPVYLWPARCASSSREWSPQPHGNILKCLMHWSLGLGGTMLFKLPSGWPTNVWWNRPDVPIKQNGSLNAKSFLNFNFWSIYASICL